MFMFGIKRLTVILITILFSMISITSVASQETVAKIVNVAYPKVVPEARPFNLTVSIQNFGNTTEMFLVRIVRRHIFSIQKEIIIPERSVGNVTLELRLLLSGDLRIEVLLDNKLVDFYSFSMEVPTPETDVGLLMIELVQTEITTVGVTLAGLAIFATMYIQARHKWLVEKLELVENLKKQERKPSKKEKRIMECASFLLQGDYDECLTQFLNTSLVKEKLSKIVNLEKRETVRLNFEDIRNSTIAIAFVLLVAIFYGFFMVPTAPQIIDAILFLHPSLGGRDILLGLYFFPLSAILFFGIFWVIGENYWSQLGKFKRLLIIISYFVWVFVVYVITAFHIGFLIVCPLSFFLGFYLGRYREKQKRKILFRKELTQIKRLKENLQKLYEKSSANFEKEKDNLRQEFKSQLDCFEFAFKLIKNNAASELRNIEAMYSFGLISDKRYQRSRERYDSIAENSEKLISEIFKTDTKN